MTPPVLWLVQTNLGDHSDVEQFAQAIEAEGLPVLRYDLVPFTEAAPQITHDGPVLCHGSTNFTMGCLAVAAERGWFPVGWHDDEAFRWSVWAEKLGSLLLNDPMDCTLTTIGDFIDDDRQPDVPLFVRPNRDLKEFNGHVTTAGGLRAWCADVAEGGYVGVSAETEIVIGTPWTLRAEWRLFMVEGRCVAASQYRENGHLKRDANVPDEVIAFGERTAATWSPAPVFTLDVCRCGDGLFVVEAQGFNSAGHYAADMGALVRAVSAYAARIWSERTSGSAVS